MAALPRVSCAGTPCTARPTGLQLAPAWPRAAQHCTTRMAALIPPGDRSAAPVPPSAPRSAADLAAGINVTVVEPPPVQPPPEPLAVMHSTAFLRQRKRVPLATVPVAADGTQLATSSGQQQQQKQLPARSGGGDNAISWALERVDRQLDQIEANPPALLKGAYSVANGPVGEATSKGVQAAANLTMAATSQAVRVAAPIGSWALKEGFKVASKAAVGLVSMAMEQREAREAAEREEGAKGKKDGGRR